MMEVDEAGRHTILEIRDVSFSYNHAPVLENVTMSITAGRTAVLMGPNGSGKTTLLKILDLLFKPAGGKILFDGTDILSLNAREARKWRLATSLVFQEPFLFNASVEKNLAYPLRIRKVPKKTIRRKVEEIADELNLAGLLHKKPHQLSGGDKKRAGLAQALITNPRLLLLDEPTASADPENAMLIEEHLKDMKERSKTMVLMTTHDVFQARRLADDLAFLHNGRIVEQGTCDEIFAGPKVELTKKFLDGEILV